jgi:hypothetical protein
VPEPLRYRVPPILLCNKTYCCELKKKSGKYHQIWQNLLRNAVVQQRLLYCKLINGEFFVSYLLMQAASEFDLALSYKPEGRGIASRWGGFFLIYPILPAALPPLGRLSL